MDKETRRMIRQMLIVAGAKRTGFSFVNPDGSYTENWTHPDGTEVTIAWGAHR
jgi:hypothetical protein